MSLTNATTTRSGNEYEGWLPASTANWYPATPGLTPGQDFVSGAADWGAEVDWSDHMQMGGGLFTIGLGGGRCDDLLSGVSYWCGKHIPRGDNYLHNGPGGLRHTAPGVPACLPSHSLNTSITLRTCTAMIFFGLGFTIRFECTARID